MKGIRLAGAGSPKCLGNNVKIVHHDAYDQLTHDLIDQLCLASTMIVFHDAFGERYSTLVQAAKSCKDEWLHYRHGAIGRILVFGDLVVARVHKVLQIGDSTTGVCGRHHVNATGVTDDNAVRHFYDQIWTLFVRLARVWIEARVRSRSDVHRYADQIA